MQGGYLTKIDFDRCNLSEDLTVETYERDICSREIYQRFHFKKSGSVTGYRQEFDKENPIYRKEKLETRRKLSELTEEQISTLAEDCGFKSEDEKQRVIQECMKRSSLAKALLEPKPTYSNTAFFKPSPPSAQTLLDAVFSFIMLVELAISNSLELLMAAFSCFILPGVLHNDGPRVTLY